MKKYVSLLRYEFKTIVKDPMNLFMLVYPPMMLAICAYLLPFILEQTNATNTEAEALTLLIGFAVVLAIGSYLMGALLGFSLLDHKDENTLLNIAVSPITVSGYSMFKLVYSFLFAIIANVIMLGGLKLLASDTYTITYGSMVIGLLDPLSYGEIVVFAIVNSLFVTAIAFSIAAFAKNKIEGFAIVKGGGMILFIPILTLLEFFQDGKQYLLGIVPIFWPFKAILNESLRLDHASNIGFWGYMVIGAVLSIALGYVALRHFLKKVSLK